MQNKLLSPRAIGKSDSLFQTEYSIFDALSGIGNRQQRRAEARGQKKREKARTIAANAARARFVRELLLTAKSEARAEATRKLEEFHAEHEEQKT